MPLKLLIDLLIRIALGERLERASSEEVRRGFLLLSLLCVYGLVLFHFPGIFKGLDRLLDMQAIYSIPIGLLVIAALVAPALILKDVFIALPSAFSVAPACVLLLWMAAEIVWRVKHFS